ncbi:MAG: hypothetical protein PHV79_01690, partial [Clostridia bacterium]|nr:hypothetical protein [Clostridia bacterium]
MKLIFENLTAFQNIMFVISALAFVLLVSYLIILQFKNKQKEVIVSDDIDSQTEPFEDAFGFIFSAFKIKGCLFLLFFGSISIFLFSLVLETWLAVLIGLLVGCVSTVIVGFIDRKPVGEIGELATVSVEIPAKGKGTGRVILLEDNSEIEAESIGRAIKKG